MKFLFGSGSKSDFLKVSIRIVRIVEFTYPENGVQVFIAGVCDVVGIPDGHVNIGWPAAVKIKVNYPVCSDAPQLNPGFSLDHCKTLRLADMEMITTGNSRLCGRE